MRRIVRNGILEAAQQLSMHAPGVVAISSDFTPPQALVDTTLGGIVQADATLLQSVGAVVIAGSDASTVVWENPAWADHPVCRELRSPLATDCHMIEARPPHERGALHTQLDTRLAQERQDVPLLASRRPRNPLARTSHVA
jgi:hypothetical protein